jgi:hypothetical protein
LKNDLKIAAQCQAKIRLVATVLSLAACHVWLAETAARSTATRAPCGVTARRTTRRRLPAASRRQGAAVDLEGAMREVSGKEEGAGAHRSHGPTVRRRKRRRAAVFNGDGVAPVVVDECGGVLQLEGDQGVRRRRSIEEWSSSEGCLPEKGRSVVTLRWGPTRRRGSGGGKPTRQTPRRWGMRVRHSGVDGRDERRAGGGGGARPAAIGSLFKGRRGAWLQPAGGVPTAAQQWRADTADAWAPAGDGRESEERGARGPA